MRGVHASPDGLDTGGGEAGEGQGCAEWALRLRVSESDSGQGSGNSGFWFGV